MPILELLQNHFPSYLCLEARAVNAGGVDAASREEEGTLTALKHHESLPTLSHTLNVYEWPLEELRAVRRSLITQALKKLRQKRGRPPFL